MRPAAPACSLPARETSFAKLYRLWEELEKPGAFAYWESSLRWDPESADSAWNLRTDAFPDFQPQFPQVVLSRGSTAVDFVGGVSGIGGQGLLLSEKALGVLEGLKLPPHQHYAVEVVHKNGKPAAQRYCWLQVLALDNHGWIDFAESRFALKPHLDMSDAAGEPLTIGNENDLKSLMQAKRSDFHLQFTKLALNSAYARAPFDLFYFDWLGGLASSQPIVNETLKQRLERQGLAGYRLSGL